MKGRLLALSSAAVLAVYTAGYAKTRSAAQLLDAEDRRPELPRPASQDRSPLPATPDDPKLVPAVPVSHTPAPAAADAPRTGRETISEAIDTSRRNPEATAEKRVIRAVADLAAKTASQPAAEATVAMARPAELAAPAPAAPAAPVAQAVPAPAQAATGSLESGAAAPAVEQPQAPLGPKWKDGRYTGWGTSRHGDLQASIFIEGGRIATASISQCLTRYPCDWIVKLPPQVVQRQSAEVDFVSGATESTNAFYYAVLQALAKAAQ